MGVFFEDIDLAEKCWYQNLYLQMIEIRDDPTFITEDYSLRTFSCYVELHRNGYSSTSKSINGKCQMNFIHFVYCTPRYPNQSHPASATDGKNHIIIPTPIKFLPVESFEKCRKSVEGVADASAGDALVLRKPEKQYGCKSLSIMSPEQSLALQLKEKGTQAFKKGNYEEALKFYTQAIENHPEQNRILTNRASCLNMMERYDEAIDDCEKALMIEPNCGGCSSRTYIQKGKAYMGLGQFDEARKCYRSLRRVGQAVMADICLKKVNEISAWF